MRSRRPDGRRAPARLAGIIVAGLAVTAASPAQEPPPSLGAHPTTLSESIDNGDRLGRLRLRGLVVLPRQTVNGLRFAGLSGLAWDDDEGVLYALSDKGSLFGLRPQFRNGNLIDAQLVSAAALRQPNDNRPLRRWRADSEGLDIANGRNGRTADAELIVSFEGDPPRIARYRPDGQFLRDEPLPELLRHTGNYHSSNASLEAVCLHPRLGLLTAAEQPLRDEPAGTSRLFTLNGQTLSYARGRGGTVSLECLPDGDVIVLERDFTPALLRTVISLRRLKVASFRPGGSPLVAESLATLDSSDGLLLDNFEGLARHRNNHFFLVSDDNDMFLQRTLLMYVELLP